MSMNRCLACGANTFSDEMAFMWSIASMWFPLVALGDKHLCESCVRYKLGFRMTKEWLVQRATWLDSGADLVVLNVKDPETRESLRKGAKIAREYRKMLLKEKRQRQKKLARSELRKFKRERKARLNAMREVLERAAE